MLDLNPKTEADNEWESVPIRVLRKSVPDPLFTSEKPDRSPCCLPDSRSRNLQQLGSHKIIHIKWLSKETNWIALIARHEWGEEFDQDFSVKGATKNNIPIRYRSQRSRLGITQSKKLGIESVFLSALFSDELYEVVLVNAKGWERIWC